MDEHDFVSERTGRLLWEPRGMYYRFEPHELPFDLNETPELSEQAQRTMLAIGNLNGLTHRFTGEQIDRFRLPFMLKEAQLSSEIEGTRSTLSDVYREQKIVELDPEKRLDNEEIRNYRDALEYALDSHEPLSPELIKEVHRILLRGVRGADRDPGRFKREQNAIGQRSDTLDSAKFVPASPERTELLVENLVAYLSEKMHVLYRIAISHYQFEAIHPFRDGNGRLGRLLIVLLLCRKDVLRHPLLYVSEYLARNRDAYIEALYAVSAKGAIEAWIAFLLKALEVQAHRSGELLLAIDRYREETIVRARAHSQSPRMHDLVSYLLVHPFITTSDVRAFLAVSQPAAWGLLRKLVEADIVREVDAHGRTNVYVAHRYLSLLEGRSM
jgi:Fic family protein